MNGWSLHFGGPFPPTVLAVFAALAIAALIRRVRADGAGVAVRALAFAALLLGIADPAFVREDRRPLKDVVAVIVDRSGSQDIGDRALQTTKVKTQVEAAFKALGDVELRVVESDRNDTENRGTRLFDVLHSTLADVAPERVGGALFITDGVVHDAPKTAEELGFHAPFHALITGHEGERDRRIELTETPRFGIVGKEAIIGVRVLDTDDRGEPVRLSLRRDGETIATLGAKVGDKLEVKAPVDHAGANVFELEVEALPNELTAINNRTVVTIEGVRDKLRVLLVSGEPHQGERMWRNLLKSDANVDLVHFTILRPPEKSSDGTPINELSLIAFPINDLFGKKIKDFDLIVFDRYSSQSILPRSYLQNIVNYVRSGGALLMAEGPDFATPEGLFFTPIGDVTPARPTGDVIEEAFRVTISKDGRKHPVTRGLSGSETWGRWMRRVGAEITEGVNVLSGDRNSPLLVLSRAEKGRVALLLTDQMWLWARGFDGGGPQVDLLRRLAHWLMKEPDLEEEALRASAHGRTLTIERQSVKGEAGETTLISPSGKTRLVKLEPVEPGLARATVETDEFGLHRVGDGERQALVNVGPDNAVEYQEVVSTLEKLRPIAEATGGGVRRLSLRAGDDLNVPRIVSMHEAPTYSGSDYIGFKRAGASVLVGVKSARLLADFAGLALLLGLAIAAWLVEGRIGGRREVG